MANYSVTHRVRVEAGINLPWYERERYGRDLLYGPGPKEGKPMYPERELTGAVLKWGTTFISEQTLEELLEIDNSYGSGNSYLLGYHEGMALEEAGLVTRETRGGFYTSEAQRESIEKILEEISSYRTTLAP